MLSLCFVLLLSLFLLIVFILLKNYIFLFICMSDHFSLHVEYYEFYCWVLDFLVFL